ncbi:MAG: ribonuclease H-like domain-containing protein [Bacillota bacterium]
MDLYDRIRRTGGGEAHVDRPELTREKIGTPIEDVVEGFYEDTPYGHVFISERCYEIEHYHGAVRLANWLMMPSEGLVCLGKEPELTDLDLGRVLFFDTETTGLGGAGVCIFLAGVAYYRDGQFTVRQYFMTDFDQETALLWSLNQLMGEFDVLATFNGRAFDWPLWQQRLLMSRMRPKMGDPLHIDLLPMARRLWKERLPSCSLGSLERAVLGVERVGDVPGELIPQLYFQYLASQDARELEAVFYHNHLDVLSMITLMSTLAEAGADPRRCLSYGADFYSLGKVYDELDDEIRALACYEQALGHPMTKVTRERTLQRLSFLHKRLRQRNEAVRIWRSMIDEQSVGSLFPYVELAKHYEHQERDYERARRLVVIAIQMLRGSRWLGSSPKELADLEHRLARLDMKIAKEEAKAQRPERKSRC